MKIHPGFHVSQLEKHIGSKAIPSPNLPMVTADGTVKTGPAAVLQVRQVPWHNLPVVQWYIQWENLPLEDATWEDADFIKYTFPEFFRTTTQEWRVQEQTPWGHAVSQEGGNVRTEVYTNSVSSVEIQRRGVAAPTILFQSLNDHDGSLGRIATVGSKSLNYRVISISVLC